LLVGPPAYMKLTPDFLETSVNRNFELIGRAAGDLLLESK